MITFSVMIPVYNAKSVLNRCIQSVLDQTEQNFELLLVDDGSTDGSGELCDQWGMQDPRVRVIHQQNKGVSATRNVLLANARGEYIAPIDADDWVEPEYLQVLYALCKRWHVSVAACNHWLHGSHRQQVCFDQGASDCLLTAQQACHGVLYHRPPDVCIWGKIYRRTLLDGFRYPEGRLYEDTWLFADLMIAAGKIAYTPAPLYHYWQEGSSICRGAYSPERMDYLLAVEHLTEVVLKHFPQEQKGCIRRKAHAALSVRRYLIDAPPELIKQRNTLNSYIAAYRKALLSDKEAPWRDKAAILLLMLSNRCFDMAWKGYMQWKGFS